MTKAFHDKLTLVIVETFLQCFFKPDLQSFICIQMLKMFHIASVRSYIEHRFILYFSSYRGKLMIKLIVLAIKLRILLSRFFIQKLWQL